MGLVHLDADYRHSNQYKCSFFLTGRGCGGRTTVNCLLLISICHLPCKLRPCHFPPLKDTSGSKHWFYFSEKTLNFIIAPMALILWQYTFALLFCTELCVTMHMVDLSLSLRPKSKKFFVTGVDSSVVRAPDSWSKCRGFESLKERPEYFLLQCQLSVLILILVSVPHPCAVARKRPRSFCQKCRWQVIVKNMHAPYVCGFA